MTASSRTLWSAFRFAGEGVGAALGQRNMKIHWVAATAVMLVGSTVPFSAAAQVVLWLSVGLVLAAEVFNCALEALVDLTTPQLHPLAKRAKDAAAGAVLILAVSAVGALGLVLQAEWSRIVWPDAWTTVVFGVPFLGVTGLALRGRGMLLGASLLAGIALAVPLATASHNPVFFSAALGLFATAAWARWRRTPADAELRRA
jgi:diacylglycerol kinase